MFFISKNVLQISSFFKKIFFKTIAYERRQYLPLSGAGYAQLVKNPPAMQDKPLCVDLHILHWISVSERVSLNSSSTKYKQECEKKGIWTKNKGNQMHSTNKRNHWEEWTIQTYLLLKPLICIFKYQYFITSRWRYILQCLSVI